MAGSPRTTSIVITRIYLSVDDINPRIWNGGVADACFHCLFELSSYQRRLHCANKCIDIGKWMLPVAMHQWKWIKDLNCHSSCLRLPCPFIVQFFSGILLAKRSDLINWLRFLWTDLGLTQFALLETENSYPTEQHRFSVQLFDLDEYGIIKPKLNSVVFPFRWCLKSIISPWEARRNFTWSTFGVLKELFAGSTQSPYHQKFFSVQIIVGPLFNWVHSHNRSDWKASITRLEQIYVRLSGDSSSSKRRKETNYTLVCHRCARCNNLRRSFCVPNVK